MNSVTSKVSADEYLRGILARERIDASMRSPLRELDAEVLRLCRDVFGDRRYDFYTTGGFEKGTANASGCSIDFFASLPPSPSRRLGDVFEGIHGALEARGYEPVRRDISVAVTLRGVGVDIIPARRETMTTDVHEVWLSRLGRPVKTNLTQHILDTAAGGRREEIRVLKIWRDQQSLDFPSFYLELSVLAALRKRPQGALAENVWAVFGYLENLFPARSVLDPVNANNIVSDLLGPPEKDAIRKAAQYARSGRAWSEIIW